MGVGKGSVREQRLCSHNARLEQTKDACRNEEYRRGRGGKKEEEYICGYILGERGLNIFSLLATEWEKKTINLLNHHHPPLLIIKC